MEGVDYAFDKPSIQGLAQVGKKFACRYVGPGSTSKHLTKAEAAELTRHGLSIVANAEGAANGLLMGRTAGAAWARDGFEHARACGMPPDRPVYLSVDFDCKGSDWPKVAAALKGAADAIGASRVGVYGGYDVMVWAQRDRVAAWFWQTYAWSEGRWASHAHIRQYRNGVSLVGGTVDLNQSMKVDFGQWEVGDATDPGNGDGDTMEARDVWFEPTIGSPALDLAWKPADWIKGGEAARRQAAIAVENTAEILRRMDEAGEVIDTTELMAKLEAVSTQLEELADQPLIDPVAVAAAIANRPEIARTLAEQVAQQLGMINGEITLSGSLNGTVRPPTT